VVSGQTLDSNSAWMAEQLTVLGFRVMRHTTIGDRVEDIRAALEQAAGRSDLLLCSGGLGPTEDDLTADAVAVASGRSLIFDEQAMRQIEAMFTRFGKPMPDSNRKQALLPGEHGKSAPRTWVWA
jgi:molybdenum cofactor synthesis domain-containing protein